MDGIKEFTISEDEVAKIVAIHEGHFAELKSIDIEPSKLTRSVAAFANAEGGELLIGIEENTRTGVRRWRGFKSIEAANGHLQAFDRFFPFGQDVSYQFLASNNEPGVLLKVEISKTREIRKASNGKIYKRRGAQNLPVDTREKEEALALDKGIVSFESNTIGCDESVLTNSTTTLQFMIEIVPSAEPDQWLRKQMLITASKPTVAGILVFAEVPQAILPKRTGIKIYRYKTSDPEGTRETLDFNPLSIEGPACEQIQEAVRTTQETIEAIQVRTLDGLANVNYPKTALHEIITNAVLHRDYSIADDIHIRIFDNRVEVSSPGTLSGHVTTNNILKERFARNPMVVRIVNKFPDPPNKDVGEGLNTAFQAMREMKLKEPLVSQSDGYVTVTLKHERLASPEEMILEYLAANNEIANRQARDICYIGSENKMKRILQKMVKDRLIELVPSRTQHNAAYRLPNETNESSNWDNKDQGLLGL